MSKEVIEENVENEVSEVIENNAVNEEDKSIEEKDECEYEYVNEYGSCIYCGQVHMVEAYEGDIVRASSKEEYLNLLATEDCKCFQATKEKRIKTQVERGKEVVKQYFAEDFPDVSSLMCEAVELLSREKIKKITIDTGKNIKAILEVNANNNIKVQRKLTKNNVREV
ncbi:MAG: hypothetical protein E7262_09610 [Lachnospiraceae bacterium]|nr:hypothetical protein [Lachnospiraceae bacterium]